MDKPRASIISTEILSDNWYLLKKINYQYLSNNGTLQIHTRESYDRGNGAAILLYNKAQKTVVLTKQFRLSTFINGNKTGMLIEACAGLLEKDNPEGCIKKETQEELGYDITAVHKVMEAYMSPGSVTELLYFFIAEYNPTMRTKDGGGVAAEQEEIEVLEMTFNNALAMIASGEIKDGKTIMLLQYLRLNNIL